MKSKLKLHALTLFSEVTKYLHLILDNFPEEKIEEKINDAQTPLQYLQHLAGTGAYWMKQSGRSFSFSSRIYNIDEFFNILDKQYDEFKEFLKNEEELYWRSDDETKPKVSIPWIMIRTANHAMHHASMLIVYRHIFGLGPLDSSAGKLWGKIVDLAGEINYSKLN